MDYPKRVTVSKLTQIHPPERTFQDHEPVANQFSTTTPDRYEPRTIGVCAGEFRARGVWQLGIAT